MIMRTWRGVVRRVDADRYADYIRETGFAEYGETPGNRGAWLLRRDDGDETEFVTLSLWESREAIVAFAGDDIEAAVLYPEDAEYLLGESTITHHDVADVVEAPPRRLTVSRSRRGSPAVRRQASCAGSMTTKWSPATSTSSARAPAAVAAAT